MTDTVSTTSLVDLLTTIREERGTLTPALLVDLARDPQHPLHSRFEWADSVAAHKWRLEQAGQLLRVTYRPDPKTPSDLRAFVALKGEESPSSEYVPTHEALEDPFTRELLLRRMKREAKTFADRYKHMAEFAAVVSNMLSEVSA